MAGPYQDLFAPREATPYSGPAVAPPVVNNLPPVVPPAPPPTPIAGGPVGPVNNPLKNSNPYQNRPYDFVASNPTPSNPTAKAAIDAAAASGAHVIGQSGPASTYRPTALGTLQTAGPKDDRTLLKNIPLVPPTTMQAPAGDRYALVPQQKPAAVKQALATAARIANRGR